MAMQHSVRFISYFLLLAAFSVPSRTDFVIEAIESLPHVMDITKTVHEVAHEADGYLEKAGAVARGAAGKLEFVQGIFNKFAPPPPARSNAFPVRQIIHTGSHKLPVGDGWSGAVRSIRTGNHRFSVLVVDVANMFTMTSMCEPTHEHDLGSSWVICNSPPTAAVTWVLFKGTVVVEGALREQQAQARAFYLCIKPPASSQASSSSNSLRAVLGLGPAGSLPQAFKNFSYHLGAEGRQTTVWLGGASAVGRPTATIRLIGNLKHPERYYVSVTGIQVDGKPLDNLPPGILELNPRDGTGGVYMRSDPFDTYTYLNRAVYSRLVGEFQKRLYPAVPTVHSKLQEGRLCYTGESLAQKVIPKLALVFAGVAPGRDAIMQLHMDNYWSQEQQLQCLAIKPSPWPTGESVLGSRLQWGWRMTYDLKAGTLQATPAAAILGNP